jgi:hypothetical protein
MQINNHITPSSLGHGSRPDHAGGANGRGQQFQPVTETVEPAATTDTADAVATVEEPEETTGPGKSGDSPAHQARALSGLQGSNNFGWLVSQIARGISVVADAPAEGDGTDGTDGVAAATDVVEDGEETPVSDVADETPIVEETSDPVVDLVDELLDDSEDGTEVT